MEVPPTGGVSRASSLFADALAEVRQAGNDGKPITSPKYRKTLGTLAIKQGMKGRTLARVGRKPEYRYKPATLPSDAAGRTGRQVYLEGRPVQWDQKYRVVAGVFICFGMTNPRVEAGGGARLLGGG